MPQVESTADQAEVSDILNRMPSWAVQGMVYAIVGFVAIGLLVANWSMVDVAIQARGALDGNSQALVKVANKDIGLVEIGQPAKLKIDAYPFQRFGAVPAKVTNIAPTPQGEDPRSFYQVTLEPTGSLQHHGKPIALRTGLTLTGEIITDRKSLLTLLLEPFQGGD